MFQNALLNGLSIVAVVGIASISLTVWLFKQW